MAKRLYRSRRRNLPLRLQLVKQLVKRHVKQLVRQRGKLSAKPRLHEKPLPPPSTVIPIMKKSLLLVEQGMMELYWPVTLPNLCQYCFYLTCSIWCFVMLKKKSILWDNCFTGPTNQVWQPSKKVVGCNSSSAMIQLFLTIVIFLRLIGSSMGAGAPNRPLPPTPDEDANERTLIMKRVSLALSIAFSLSVNNYSTPPSPPTPLKQNKSSTRGTVETGQGDGHFDLNVGYFRSLFSLSLL